MTDDDFDKGQALAVAIKDLCGARDESVETTVLACVLVSVFACKMIGRPVGYLVELARAFNKCPLPDSVES